MSDSLRVILQALTWSGLNGFIVPPLGSKVAQINYSFQPFQMCSCYAPCCVSFPKLLEEQEGRKQMANSVSADSFCLRLSGKSPFLDSLLAILAIRLLILETDGQQIEIVLSHF